MCNASLFSKKDVLSMAAVCRYAAFVQALEHLSLGNLEWAKRKALKAAHELLAAKPEQEAKLLQLLVNKLGDPCRRMASNAGYLISCLLTEHPLMCAVVVREMESFLFRCCASACGWG
jgi:ribosome biogenesis protein MAK21